MESQSSLVVSRDEFPLILTDKAIIIDDCLLKDSSSRAISITPQGVLYELDRHGNPVNNGALVGDIKVIEWGTIKNDLTGFAIGLAGVGIGMIALFFLPSRSGIVEAVEATLCFLGVLLAWASITSTQKVYLLCKGEQMSIGFTLRVPLEIASSGIRRFIEEIRVFHGMSEPLTIDVNHKETPSEVA